MTILNLIFLNYLIKVTIKSNKSNKQSKQDYTSIVWGYTSLLYS
jgi:hypothetical protein